jgi:hypothetical protein
MFFTFWQNFVTSRTIKKLFYSFTLKMKMRLDGVWFAFDTEILDSEIENEAKLIRLEQIIVSFETSRDLNTEILCVNIYKI